MVVRIFAILLALGMLVISTQATDLATPDTAAFVDVADDVPPAILVEAPTVISDQPEAQVSSPTQAVPAGYWPESDLFRPPRVAAFA